MRRLIVALPLLILLASMPALAGVSVGESKVLDRWTLRLGGYLTGLSTEIRLDSSIEDLGTSINLEDDLGFSSSESVPRVSLSLILGKRHEITVGYYETDRDSSTTLTEEIEWGDETFPINVDVAAFYTTTFFDAAYTYWLYSSESTALGITGGLVLANLKAGIGLAALGAGIEISDDISTDVPVPQLGFRGRTYLGKKFVLTGGVGYIALNIENYSGSVGTAAVSIEHRTWKNFGFGLGYAYSDYDVDAEDQDFLGSFTYTISGFEIYARAAW